MFKGSGDELVGVRWLPPNFVTVRSRCVTRNSTVKLQKLGKVTFDTRALPATANQRAILATGFPLLYGMKETTMRAFGLYISEPLSAQETDHHFPEPALFVVNPDGALQLVDAANARFLRPDFDRLVGRLCFVIERGFPIRGTME